MKNNLKKIDYTGKTIFIGLDAHKKSWYITVLFLGFTERKSMSASSKGLYSYLTSHYPGANYELAYEAGYCGFSIYEELTALGVNVKVVNPADIPTTDKESRNKTDKADSKKIAKCLQAGLLTSIYIPSKKQQNDRALLRFRKSLVKQQTSYKNRIKAFLSVYGIELPEEFSEPGSHWSRIFIEILEKIDFCSTTGNMVMAGYIRELRSVRQHILDVTREIRKLASSEYYNKYYKILMSTPGIGPITAMTLLTEIGDISRFKSVDKLLSYIGIVPTEHSSGERQKTGNMNKRQNRQLRSVIIESAWIAIRKDPSLSICYNKHKNPTPSKGIIRAAKKLVSKIYHIWNTEEYYVTGVA